uniref:Uncharacterized protein n=1 Tax=Poecilia latipinna TaxID=48699 RepID=A0A3B3UVD5_9TELE
NKTCRKSALQDPLWTPLCLGTGASLCRLVLLVLFSDVGIISKIEGTAVGLTTLKCSLQRTEDGVGSQLPLVL